MYKYIKGRALYELLIAQSKDSNMWKAILKNREDVVCMMECSADYSFRWTRAGTGGKM